MEVLERQWSPVEDSICEAQRKLFAATDGVRERDDWPEPLYGSDQVVIFREHNQAPLQRGIIVGVSKSRGDWAPRGVYYDVECPQRITTIIRLPESNIFQVLGSAGDDVEEEPWMRRASLCWNAGVDGWSFDIHPASQSGVIAYWRDSSWDSRLDTYGHLLNIDEYDFHLFVRDLFESWFDNSNPANAEWQRQDGMGGQAHGFDWYGENFYSLESARAILDKVLTRSLDDPQDFYSRFATLLEAVIDKAEALNAEPGSKGDFGIRVVGP